MAFTNAEVESAGSDAWTGKSTSLVYVPVATASAWLSRRGFTSFSGSASSAQEAALLRATEDAEDLIRRAFRGVPVGDGQRLLFPAYGAYDGRGRLLDQTEAPQEYLEGIYLIAEEIRAGTYMATASTGAGVVSMSTRNSSVTFQSGFDAASLAANHPAVWRKLAMALPRTL